MGTDLDTVCTEIYPLYIQHITSLVEYLVGQGVLQLSQLTPDALDTLSGEQDYLSSCCWYLVVSSQERQNLCAMTLYQICGCNGRTQSCLKKQHYCFSGKEANQQTGHHVALIRPC